MNRTPIKKQTEQCLNVLCLNLGSTTLKFSVNRVSGQAVEAILTGKAVLNISDKSTMEWYDSDGEVRRSKIDNADTRKKLIQHVLKFVADRTESIDAVGHRVVHGGAQYTAPVIIDKNCISYLESIVLYAPLHMPGNLECVRSVTRLRPELPQVACFDTAFHATIPSQAGHVNLPRYLRKLGIRKYGFHGLSCEYSLSCLTRDCKESLIILHLGGGASLTAVRQGSSVDTTMGMTPSGGVMMGTRCGDIDPGIILHLIRHFNFNLEELNDLLNTNSGLLGVSELSSDMKYLLSVMNRKSSASEAVDMFCYQMVKQIGAYNAILGGVKDIVFTGGIGENAPVIRDKICRPLEHLGLILDDQANQKNEGKVSANDSKIRIHVIPCCEDHIISRQVFKVVGALKPVRFPNPNL